MRRFGLIGKGIGHSFSANYFNNKFAENSIDAVYSLFDLNSIADFEEIKKIPGLAGINVTSPYKREIIPFLDAISDSAKELNAVNVIEIIRNDSGKIILKGHNTDSEGFGKTLNVEGKIKSAMILGTGGASSAVGLALSNRNIPFKTVSRNPKGDEISYKECNELIPQTDLIINATPVGMYPDTNIFPDIDYDKICNRHFCYDLIYNPQETLFLKKSRLRGAKTQNGFQMLINQAELAWKIWQNNEWQNT